MARTQFHRNETAAVHVHALGDNQLHLTAAVDPAVTDPSAAAHDVYAPVAAALAADGLHVVHERIFGSLAAREAVLEAREAALQAAGLEPERPLTYVEGRPLAGEGPAGVQIHALRVPEPGDRLWTITHDGAPCGHGWMRHGTTFLLIQNVHGLGPSPAGTNGRSRQAERMFARAAAVLAENGADYRHVVRTWIYLNDILDWYGPFNAARNAKYTELGLMGPAAGGAPLPASTGIEGANPLGAACIMDVLAVVPGAPLAVEPMRTPRQNEAPDYGSAFSRGMCVREPDVVHLMVSGTAAIDEAGASLHAGDAASQIRRTLENVEALLAGRGGRLADACEATVFLKRAEDGPVYREVAAEFGLAQMPAVVVTADVCRDELLFEIDALVERAPGA